jgi:hypothetical protein
LTNSPVYELPDADIQMYIFIKRLAYTKTGAVLLIMPQNIKFDF